MLRGSCLCKGVAFEIVGSIQGLLYCHCGMCRKAHGSAFRARGSVKASEFRWKRGETLVRFYESSPGQHRGFCSVCGSNILTRFDADVGTYGLALGSLDDDPGLRPECHVYVGSKAPWHEIADTLPQHREGVGTAPLSEQA
ncbi:GFA family protein [Bordetella sp. N]|uniref:GFA family protein n=1 Tax=Bordetella sp. N TaxID=1746199 RepID=UPI00070A97FA|nr:GFA family protein [Bordetella sp. N]ALM86000.1 aldehyde-activating protein [Bordetella sp. N]